MQLNASYIHLIISHPLNETVIKALMITFTSLCVIRSTHNNALLTRATGRLSEGELDDETQHSNYEAYHKAPKCALQIKRKTNVTGKKDNNKITKGLRHPY